MKRAIILFFLSLTLCNCDRYPSQLQPSEQVQALIFEHLASQLFERSSADDESLRLFLCYGDPQGDPSQAVQTYVSRVFRSARPCSAVDPLAEGPVKERGTGREGFKLIIAPFALTGDGPHTIQAGYFVAGRHAEGFEYRIQRVNGRWKILGRKQLWIS